MAMALISKRVSDGKLLYFRDEESREEYELVHDDEELEDAGFCFDVPFGEQVFDCDDQRSNMEMMMKFAGVSSAGLSMDEIYGRDTKEHSYDDTGKRLKEYRNMARKTYDFGKGELVETDDDYREIRIRQMKVENNRLFRAFVDALDDDRKELVRVAFKNNGLDLNNLEEYFDQELNMNIDPYLEDYETEKAMIMAMKAYQETDDYKTHKIFATAVEEAFDAVREADINDDKKSLIPKIQEPQAKLAVDDLEGKVMVNGKYENQTY